MASTSAMRITFVLPYAGFAGGVRVVAIYAQRLRQRGHKVKVVSTWWHPPGRIARARTRVQNLLDRLNLRVMRMGEPSHFTGLNIDHDQIRQMRAVTNEDLPDADVVVATWWETAHWVNDLVSEKGAKAYFMQDYGAHEGQPLDRVAETWRLPLHKIVISKWLMRMIEQHSGDSSSDYVPNAVNLDQFRAPPRTKQHRPTVGFVYNTSPQKGCDVMLKAIELARRTCPDLRVVAYGPGTPEPHLPLPRGTKFWSYAPEQKLRDIYSMCDAWLFGSRSEGFGLPILEAMACRTPVIGTPAGAAPDLLCDGGGMQVGLNDAEAMAKAILNIVAMPDEAWRAMSEAAHATASRYTWDDATNLFEAALIKAIAKSKQMEPTAV